LNHNKDVVRILRNKKDSLKPVLPFDFTKTLPVIFDLSISSGEMEGIDLNNIEKFTKHIFSVLRRQDTQVGIGRYAEDRMIYRYRSLFKGRDENRSIHLGIDLFVEPGTKISTPLPAEVHSFANNQIHGDYGPTIILRHQLENVTFFTLYGHLSTQSLAGQHSGRRFAAGEVFARIGETQENGGWPPHLHFQIITDMGQWKGDFPGVTSPSLLERYLQLCPDPNLILGIPGLEKNN
jgi:murein DD-endopeptidase MepM/ murein hydrolase activator NlpD